MARAQSPHPAKLNKRIILISVLRMRDVLEVRGLTVSTGGRRLVGPIEFSVARGERVALLGASGSGKSLTATAILGLLPAGLRCTGVVALSGEASSRHRPGRRPGLGAVFQATASALNPLVSVGAHFRLAGHDPKDVARLLVELGFDDPHRILSAHPMNLSGGQRQRVCLGLALMRRPAVLIADEPTTALDTVVQAEVMAAIRSASQARGTSVLFITHDLALASTLCSRALVMSEGRLVQDVAFPELVTNPAHGAPERMVSCALALSGAAA